ncbi:hypothetical protein FHY30_002343 [Xanthomonas arboricola]|nr:hypothetical protein [Xanthomonas campestris]
MQQLSLLTQHDVFQAVERRNDTCRIPDRFTQRCGVFHLDVADLDVAALQGRNTVLACALPNKRNHRGALFLQGKGDSATQVAGGACNHDLRSHIWSHDLPLAWVFAPTTATGTATEDAGCLSRSTQAIRWLGGPCSE